MDGMREYIIKVNINGKLADECLNVLNANELVRCEDCKHYENSGWFTQCFRHNGISPNNDFFCADGEHK